LKIVFAGTIGRSGLGGQAWAGLQYLLGFRALGHEVVYLEDCGKSSWVYIWEKEDWTHELDYPAAYVRACLEPFGMGDCWIYRDNYRSVGMPLEQLKEFCSSTDLLIMRAAPFWNWREEYGLPQRRAFIDVDPGFTQIAIANGDAGLTEGIARAEKKFTYAQRFGEKDCAIPGDGGPWLKTRPPVYLPEWPACKSAASHFTSIMRWQGFKEVSFRGVSYGQRDKEFPRYFDMPRRTTQKFLIAQMGIKPEELSRHGWEVAAGEIVSRTPRSYREFINGSRGEFSVPKNGYVAMRGGWFSDRSVCYLASGRPVMIEDTGLKDWLPVGEGLLTFEDPEGALECVNNVNAQYGRHAHAARHLAEEYFATDKVLPQLLEAAMN
jgi:hypothetical protein